MPSHSTASNSVQVTPGGPVHGSIRPPGSKSLTNRALICAGFGHGPSTLTGALRSEDTAVMIDAIRAIGVRVDVSDGGRTISVDPASATHPDEKLEIFVANSGTTVRFLAAALSAHGGNYRLHGVDRMHERPIGDLIDALGPVIDGRIEATSPHDCPPVIIETKGWSGNRINVAGSVSSQYLSGLMMAAPIALARGGESITIQVDGELVSRPYVDMTAKIMRSFGADVQLDNTVAVHVRGNTSQGTVYEGTVYKGTDYPIEPDAAAASYFWATAAITGGRIAVQGLSQDSMQGDVGFCEVLRKMGCNVTYEADSIAVAGGTLTGIDIDMNDISDTVQTLAVVALFASGPTRVRGAAHNRFKETDRIGDLATELRKLGATIDEHADGMTIRPPTDIGQLRGAPLETYHDHRMAMSLSLAGLRIDDICILDPACTTKTYPEYFADLEQLIGRPHRWA
jgi:3-phosphoshikimate 1-carboxyvinyltransferase